MKRITCSKGFTLTELIIVIAILAILAAILIPMMVGWIGDANKDVCFANQSQILRNYQYLKVLEAAKGNDVKLSDVLAGNYDLYTTDISSAACPSGGTYTADDENERIICSIHGNAEGDTPSGGDDENDGENEVVDTENYFYLTGDINYKVTTWGDIEKFNPEHDGQPGTSIPTGTIFYYRGYYYLFRDNQYLTASTNIPSYVAHYGVKIDNSAFTTPSKSTSPGDLKLVNDRAYVFFPYNRYQNDYLNEGWWYEIAYSGA